MKQKIFAATLLALGISMAFASQSPLVLKDANPSNPCMDLVSDQVFDACFYNPSTSTQALWVQDNVLEGGMELLPGASFVFEDGTLLNVSVSAYSAASNGPTGPILCSTDYVATAQIAESAAFTAPVGAVVGSACQKTTYLLPQSLH